MRGFEKVTNYNDAMLPHRQSKNSAGYDFYCYEDVEIKPHQKQILKTGIKAFMENDEVLLIYIRSSLAIKNNLSLVNQTGVIDSDYYNNKDNEGHILIAIKNEGKQTIYLKKNDRFAQGVFMKYLITDNDDCNKQRIGGIGSSGE